MSREDSPSRSTVRFTGAILLLAIGMFIARLFSWSVTPNIKLEGAKMSSSNFDILTATAAHLRGMLENGSLKSVDLVNAYLQQIEKHNRRGAKLHAIIATVPRELLLETAGELDRERSVGHVRGAFHGIPILVKDNMCTSGAFKLATTSGTFAFKNAIALYDAASIQQFLSAGAILLGKANLDVLAGTKGSSCPTGWSEVEGQTQSAYVRGGMVPGDTFLGHSTPGGSSAGSAVAVSAGFAPISLGTESDGSIMAPADRASLYSVKATPGSVSVEGTLPYSPVCDSLGPIARSARDIADMLTILHDGRDYSKHLNQSWLEMKLGFLDPVEWKSSAGASKPMEGYVEQVASEVSAAVDKIASAGAKTKKWISLRRFGGDGDDDHQAKVAWHDFGPSFANFVAANFKSPPVRTLQELVEFNKAHAAEALPPEFPDQDLLVDAASHEHSVSESEYREAVEKWQRNNRELGLETAMRENDVDIILGAPTGRFPSIAAAAGYPCGTLPLGYSKQNGRAFGVMAVVRPNREDLLVELMSLWESTFGPPKPPPQLVEAASAKI